MGEFFKVIFLPTLKKLVEADLSYDEVKAAGEDPEHLGCQDQRKAVRGPGKCVFLEIKSRVDEFMLTDLLPFG